MKAKKNGHKRSSSGVDLESLRRERARLRHQVKELTAERDRYRKSLIALLHEDIPVNKKEMLAMVGQQPPLRDFIEELKPEDS
jgi:hypothetical protein